MNDSGVSAGVFAAWFVAIFFLFASRKHSCGGRKAFFIPLLLVPLVAGGIYWLKLGRSAPNASVQAASETPPTVREPSTEEMWDRLTASRIKLDENAKPTPDAESSATARPDWVDIAATRVGGNVTEVVSSEPFTTVDECYAQLEHQFLVEAWRRMKNVVPENQKEALAKTPVTELGIPLDYVMREICKQEYTESVESSVGEMKRVHVLMEFTPQVESRLLSIWQAGQRQVRLGFVGKIAALVLASLGSVYGLLQVDTMTRGYYTRRLIAGASAVIIAVAAALFVR